MLAVYIPESTHLKFVSLLTHDDRHQDWHKGRSEAMQGFTTCQLINHHAPHNASIILIFIFIVFVILCIIFSYPSELQKGAFIEIEIRMIRIAVAACLLLDNTLQPVGGLPPSLVHRHYALPCHAMSMLSHAMLCTFQYTLCITLFTYVHCAVWTNKNCRIMKTKSVH